MPHDPRVETHGVSNMLRAYVRDCKAGKLDPRPGWRVEPESRGTAVIDAGRRLGIIVGSKAMRLAIEKTRTVGVGSSRLTTVGASARSATSRCGRRQYLDLLFWKTPVLGTEHGPEDKQKARYIARLGLRLRPSGTAGR